MGQKSDDSNNIVLNQENEAVSGPLARNKRKRAFDRCKELVAVAAIVLSTAAVTAVTTRCGDSTEGSNVTQSDTASTTDIGEQKDAGPKDTGIGPKDIGSEDAFDGGSPKDAQTTPDEEQPDAGPKDTGAEMETPDGGQTTDGGDQEQADASQPNDTGNTTDGPQQTDGGDQLEDAGEKDAETTDANKEDGSSPDVISTDGGDLLEDTGEGDAGTAKELCDEYPGITIPMWANVSVPWDMFVKYFSGVTGFSEKIDALKNYVTVINGSGEKVVLLAGQYDAALPSQMRIISADVLFAVAGVVKLDGTTVDGLCLQHMWSAAELDAAFQAMMSGTGN